MDTVLPAAGMLLVAFTVGFGLRAALSEVRRRQARNERKSLGPIDAEPSPAALRAERDVLAREVRQLGEHVDRLLSLLEREQALRRQMQEELLRTLDRPFVLLDEARAECAALREDRAAARAELADACAEAAAAHAELAAARAERADAREECTVLQGRLASTERRYRELKRVVAQLLRRLRARGHFAEAA